MSGDASGIAGAPLAAPPVPPDWVLLAVFAGCFAVALAIVALPTTRFTSGTTTFALPVTLKSAFKMCRYIAATGRAV